MKAILTAGTQTAPQTPLVRWTVLTSIVFLGSAWYGASVAHALGITYGRGALWLIASTGLSWCIFGPLLIAVTRRSVVECADNCLVTMTAGIAVLSAGGVVNMSMASDHGFHAVAFNWAWVAVSNVVMAAVIMRQFRSAGVPWHKTLAVWVLGLDGAGALMFWLFRHLIGAGQ